MTYAKGNPYNQSHRHFSHLIAFHPLGLIDSQKEKRISRSSNPRLLLLTRLAPTGGADIPTAGWEILKPGPLTEKEPLKRLKIFATDFCLKNSFHVNGDQSGTGKSKFTYRPFTLEGNFAFAAGIQEMLIQSHTGIVRIFPAIPEEWKDVSFKSLRAEGAFLVSAKMEKGDVTDVDIISEKGGELKILNPFKNDAFKCSAPYTKSDDILVFQTKPGQKISMGS